MFSKYAYNAPDEFRPQQSPDLYKLASQPFMGLTANIGGRPHLVIAFDGQEYTLEDTEGETIQLAQFAWDIENFSEENALVAASRSEGSPFESGCEVDGQIIGKLSYDEGEWSVTDMTGGDVTLVDLIEQLEAQGWQVEEEVNPNPEGPMETIERAASASCTDCTDEDCDSPTCQCPCHEQKESFVPADPQALDVGTDDPGDPHQVEPTVDPMSPEFAPPNPDEAPVEEPAGTEASFSGQCENCGKELGDHTLDGRRCPKGGDIGEEEEEVQQVEPMTDPMAPNVPTPAPEKVTEPEREPAKVGSFDKTTDTNGQLLRAGDFYEMRSKKYKIPDTIKIIQVSPDLLVATTHEGAVTLKIKAADVESEGYSFEPLFPTDDPDQLIESHFIETMGLEKTARKRFSLTEQKDLIDEPGEARNRAKLRLDDSHYVQGNEETVDDDDLSIYFL